MLDPSWSQSLYLAATTAVDGEEECAADRTRAIEEALRSKRMSFDPSSSILVANDEKGCDIDGLWDYQECEVLAVQSEDPYVDFRVSMEEMVQAYDQVLIKTCLWEDWDWKYLEELLAWYLKMNGKETHGFIVGAFIDMCTHPSISSCELQ